MHGRGVRPREVKGYRKRKYRDHEYRHQITSIELPTIGKAKTNYPSVAAIFLGIALAVIVAVQWPISEPPHEEISLIATIELNDTASTGGEQIPRTVYAGAIPMKYYNLQN